MRINGISWSKKQVSSLRETNPQALAFPLVRLQPGELRVPWAGSEQTCLTGKGVSSGESWGAAPGLCQAGSPWHNWKGASCVWGPAAWAVQLLGHGGSCGAVVPTASPGVTVTPGVQGCVTALHLGQPALPLGSCAAKGGSPAGWFSFPQLLPANM